MHAARYGRLGAGAQLLLAVMIGAVATLAGGATPEPFPRGVGLALIYAVPALVAYLGALRGSRSLLVAAAIVDIPGSILSWSGSTLLFLLPAILFWTAALRMPAITGRTAPSLGGVVVMVLVAALMIGAGLAVIFVTQPLCWVATELPGGTAFQIVPAIDNLPIDKGQIASCTSAAMTTLGGVLALVLELVAIAIAWTWSSRSRPLVPASS
jgi:hypothetical protein